MHSSIKISDIAQYTILRLIQNGQTICPLKLQKILYYIQAWHMVYFEGDKIFNDIPEAWVNGPVYRSIYDVYKSINMYTNIPFSFFKLADKDLDNSIIDKKESLKLEEQQYEFLEAIYIHYGSMSHDKLVYLTHSEKPWNSARDGLAPFEYSNNTISLEEMYLYYKSLSSK